MKRLEADYASSARSLCDMVRVADKVLIVGSFDHDEELQGELGDALHHARDVEKVHRVFAYQGRRDTRKQINLNVAGRQTLPFDQCSPRYQVSTSYHIISYHIISYHIISYRIISYHIISYHVMSYHIISYHVTLLH